MVCCKETVVPARQSTAMTNAVDIRGGAVGLVIEDAALRRDETQRLAGPVERHLVRLVA